MKLGKFHGVVIAVAVLAAAGVAWWLFSGAGTVPVGTGTDRAAADVATPASTRDPVGASSAPPASSRGTTDPPDPPGGAQGPYAIAPDGTFEVPPQYRFAGVRRVRTAASFEAWVAQFLPADQKLIRAFNKRNHGVYQVKSPQTVAWMAAHGYPMPEDLIAAQAMSVEQLLGMVENGNIKAAYLLKNRLSRILERKQAQYEASGRPGHEALRDNPQLGRALMEVDEAFNQAPISSPYKGYLMAASAGTHYSATVDIESRIIAGLELAHSLGDFRASRLLQAYVRADRSRFAERRLLAMGAGAGIVVYQNNIVKRMAANGCPVPIASAQDNPTYKYLGQY